MKVIVITGGVLSGLGKGVLTASIAALLQKEHKLICIKCDGYLNADPGTMNPVEHGEVYVLEDGGEVDMDFGHYERFANLLAKKSWNITMGKIYKQILEDERKGKFLGKTVQLIPHATDEIKRQIYEVSSSEGADIALIEIGGTIGDMENELFIESMRQLRADLGRNNVVFFHLTYVPFISGSRELKSKPTQSSVKALNQAGIYPDAIICRSSDEIDEEIRKKIALYCNVSESDVFSNPDQENIYSIPHSLQKQGVLDLIEKRLDIKSSGLDQKTKDFYRALMLLDGVNVPDSSASSSGSSLGGNDFDGGSKDGMGHRRKTGSGANSDSGGGASSIGDDSILSSDGAISGNGGGSNKKLSNHRPKINIALCGKYTHLEDSYASIKEALLHARVNIFLEKKIEMDYAIDFIDSEQITFENVEEKLKHVHCVIIPGGFGSRGVEGKITITNYARQRDIPFLGICLGMQVAVVEYARYVCGLEGAVTEEMDVAGKQGVDPVITLLPSQRDVLYKGGTMRLGAHEVRLKKNSILHSLFKKEIIKERFRHRYEVNPKYVDLLEENGLLFSGSTVDGSIKLMCECLDKNFFIGTQSHPELTSTPLHPSPLFLALLERTLEKNRIGFHHRHYRG